MPNDAEASLRWRAGVISGKRGLVLLDRTRDQLRYRTRATFHALEGLGHFRLKASAQ